MTTTLPVSIIIRTKNEERYFEKVLNILRNQSYRNFEIIVVDDNSTDKTLQIAKEYNCEIVKVPKGKFNHPFSCNLGAEQSRGKYLVYLNGHTIPISRTWLSDGLNNFSDGKVAGVNGTNLANPDANFLEKIFYFLFNYFFKRKWQKIEKLKDVRMGSFATINAIIRRDLWQKHHFNEQFKMGGEDLEWAKYWVKNEYSIIHDPKFNVFHSHNLGLLGLIKQLIQWIKMNEPNEFKAQVNKFKSIQ